ncbi:unnamed protein product, partial [Closterium sp. Yama58-4]
MDSGLLLSVRALPSMSSCTAHSLARNTLPDEIELGLRNVKIILFRGDVESGVGPVANGYGGGGGGVDGACGHAGGAGGVEGAEGLRRQSQGWCAGRARSLQQQFMLTADHVQVLAGLATVFGGVRQNPWAVGSCLTQRRFVRFVERMVAAQPWVHAVAYMTLINGSRRMAFEQQAQCKLLDILGKPAPEADWYMNSRVWFQENPLLPLLEVGCVCINVRTHPSYGPQLARMHQLATNLLSMPYVLDNGEAGMGEKMEVLLLLVPSQVATFSPSHSQFFHHHTLYLSLAHPLHTYLTPRPHPLPANERAGMGFPIFRDGVTTASPLEERRAALIGLIAASIDFKSLAAFIINEVLRQVAKLIPPSNESMLQPHRYKAVQQINLTDSTHTYQLWCRFGDADTVHSWTAMLLAVVIVVVAALLAGVGVSVACNTRGVREKVAALAVLKERTQAAERNKSAFIANTAHELRTPIIGLKVTCRVDTSVPEVLEGDYMRLQQVVDSIVGEPPGLNGFSGALLVSQVVDSIAGEPSGGQHC